MTTSTTLSLHLDPPKFKMDVEDDNLELWTFRLPVAVPLNALKGLEISKTGGVTKISANGQDYRLEVGDMEDTESFRVLVPKDNHTEDDRDSTSDSSRSSNDDDDDDDDEKKKKNDGKIHKLVPLKKAFSKHFSVLVDVPHLTESQVAPREGPPPQDAMMRHAYAHVPQRSGLKRRWMPLGANTSMENEQTTLSVPVASSTKATPKGVRSHSAKQETISVDKSTGASPKKRMKMEDVPSPESDDSSEVDEKLSKSERKARKAEKKAAKKAKKEAKKAKKAAKKVKKES